MKKTIADIDIENKKVIIRCDFNVPIKDGKIMDDNRIIEAIPTIEYALKKNASIILMSHLGRIKTEKDKINNSLSVVGERLSALLNHRVTFIGETRGEILEKAIKNMKNGDIILMENTRYEDLDGKKESSNNKELAAYWASLADIFINDAFGTLHRAHASNVGIATILPSGIGFLVEKELKMLGESLNNPNHPYTVILGGAKMNDKIKIIDNLIKKCDYILFGGGIANTFLKALGCDVKKSLYDEESIEHCKMLLDNYKDKIVLPIDGYSADSYEDKKANYSKIEDLKDNDMMLDIGPLSVDLFSEYIKISKTVFWNGPVGVSEFKNFEYGTKSICKILSESDAKVIVGGGDSAAAAIRFGYKDKFTHISTGGGASLEYVEGNILPGLEIIEEK